MRLAGLQLFGKLDRYVGSLFVGAYATALLLIVGLVEILHLAGNLRFFQDWEDGQGAPTSWILRYCALEAPFLYLQIAPFVTAVAAVFTVSKLLKHNELVACLNAGISARRLLLPLYAAALLVGAAMFVLREAATPSLGPERDRLYEMLNKQTLDPALDSLRLRDIQGNVVLAQSFRPQSERIERLQVIGRRDRVFFLISADAATWQMRPQGGMEWRLDGGQLREEFGDSSVRRDIEWLEGVSFTPDDLLLARKGDKDPLGLSFSEIDQLARRDPDNLEFQTLLHYHLTFPLANLVLVLITLPFLLGRERGRNAEGVVVACLMCVFYFAADFVTRSLGMDGSLSAVWASWGAVLVFGAAGAALTEGMRT